MTRRFFEKRTQLPKPPPIKTDKEKEELRKRMKDKYEVLVTGDTGGGLGVWDPSTGNCLHQYKGGVTRANTATWVKQVSRYSTCVSV